MSEENDSLMITEVEEACKFAKLPKLHRLVALCENDEYLQDRVIERVKMKRYTKAPWKKMKEVKFMNEFAPLPLHMALQSTTRAPFRVVKCLMEAYDEGVKIKNCVSGDLPLSMACHPMDTGRKDRETIPTIENGVDDEEEELPENPSHQEPHEWRRLCVTRHSDIYATIMLLMKAYPQAINSISSEGCTPLHSLLEHKPSFTLVKEMVELSAVSAAAEGQGTKSAVEVTDCERQLPLHVAIQRFANTKIILFLLHRFPRAVRESMNIGYLPLHFAALWSCTKKVLEALLRKHPRAVEIKSLKKNGGGNTPLHLVFHTEENVGRWLPTDEDMQCSKSDSDLDSEDTRKPSNIVSGALLARLMISYYHAFLLSPVSSKSKKHNKAQAAKKIQSLINTKNALGHSVIDQAKMCLEMFGENASDEMKGVVDYIEGLDSGSCEVDELPVDDHIVEESSGHAMVGTDNECPAEQESPTKRIRMEDNQT
eukprot:scaffold87262_cov63-Attheya_sp.AAC.2